MKNCKPEEVALKTFFLGPQAENGGWLISSVVQCLESWFSWRRSIHPSDGPVVSAQDQNTPSFLNRRDKLNDLIAQLLHQFEKEIPKFSPRYIGHMFSETSIPALLGHIVTLLHNPNNISGESSLVGLQIEREAIRLLFKMLGFADSSGVGHFTSGGTIANFEAVYRAHTRMLTWLSAFSGGKDVFQTAHRGWQNYDKYKTSSLYSLQNMGIFNAYEKVGEMFGRRFNGPIILGPQNMHYSWKKAAGLFGLGEAALEPVALDSQGRMDISDLKKKIESARQHQKPILMVVSIVGSTELGSIDPVDKVCNLLRYYLKRYGLHIWHHVDAAYGAFACSSKGNLFPKAVQTSLSAIPQVQSLTTDPHKLGYVPFSSGAILVKSRRDYYLHSIDAPYLNTKRKDPGPQTIEGSRSAAGAVATWLSLQAIGLGKNGYGRIVERTILNRLELEKALKKQVPNVQIVPGLDLNILCFTIAKKGERLTETNCRAQKLYEFFSPEKNNGFIVSKTTLRFSSYEKLLAQFVSRWRAKKDADRLVLIRLTLMNPFFTSKESKVSFPNSFASTLKKWLAKS